eukprot:scaffold59330_cov26-Cyclotella_meneghiniana.AAC.1
MEPLELDEDIQPLTVTGSSSTASRRHLGDRSSSILRGPITTLLIFASIGAVYILGKEKGQNLRFHTSTNNDGDDGAKMPGKMFVPKTAPVVENAEFVMEDTDTDPPVPTYDPTRIQSTPVENEDATDPPVPTYDPTKKGTDPPAPTYDPTKQGTPSPTTAAITNDETAAALYIPSPNPYIDKFNNTEWQSFNANQWDQRYENSLQIKEKYGTYCPNEPLVPMCPSLTADKE